MKRRVIYCNIQFDFVFVKMSKVELTKHGFVSMAKRSRGTEISCATFSLLVKVI